MSAFSKSQLNFMRQKNKLLGKRPSLNGLIWGGVMDVHQKRHGDNSVMNITMATLPLQSSAH